MCVVFIANAPIPVGEFLCGGRWLLRMLFLQNHRHLDMLVHVPVLLLGLVSLIILLSDSWCLYVGVGNSLLYVLCGANTEELTTTCWNCHFCSDIGELMIRQGLANVTRHAAGEPRSRNFDELLMAEEMCEECLPRPP